MIHSMAEIKFLRISCSFPIATLHVYAYTHACIMAVCETESYEKGAR